MKTLKQAQAFIQEKLGEHLDLFYVFGSFAAKRQTDDSDLDIAVLLDRPLAELERWDLAQALAVIINRDVDLVDLWDASTVLQFEIISHGQCLFERASTKAWFEVKVMRMYQKLSEERAAFLSDYQTEGKADE